jgi:hypothetical protein
MVKENGRFYYSGAWNYAPLFFAFIWKKYKIQAHNQRLLWR